MKRQYVKNLTYVALFVAVICVLSQIAIQLPPVPITLQIFAVALCGYCLGLKRASSAITVYLLLGLAGAPVFTGFKGGFYVLLSYTGGFLWGFVPLVILCSLGKKRGAKIVLGIVGVLLCHLCGAVQYAIVAKINIWLSLVTASLPYLLKDVALTLFAYLISDKIAKNIKR